MSNIDKIHKEDKCVVFDFENSQDCPSLVHVRASDASLFDSDGVLKTLPSNTPRFLKRPKNSVGGLIAESYFSRYNTNYNPLDSSVDEGKSFVQVTHEPSDKSGFIRLTASSTVTFARLAYVKALSSSNYSFSFFVSKVDTPFVHMTVEALPYHTLRVYLNMDTGQTVTNNQIKDLEVFKNIKCGAIKLANDTWQVFINATLTTPDTNAVTVNYFVGPASAMNNNAILGNKLDVGHVQVVQALNPTLPILGNSVTKATDLSYLDVDLDMSGCTIFVWYRKGFAGNRTIFELVDTVSDVSLVHEITETNNLRTYSFSGQVQNYELIDLVNRFDDNTNGFTHASVLGLSSNKQVAYSKGKNYLERNSVLPNYNKFNRLYVGCRKPGNFTLNGVVQRIAIFNKLLTEQEIRAIAKL